MRNTAGRAVLVCALAFLIVLPGGSLARAPPPTPVPGGAGLLTDAVPLPAGAADHPLDGSTPIGVALSLPFTNASGLAAFLRAVEDPTSPAYHRFLTPAQFNSAFDPTAATVATVLAALRAAGATDLSVAPDRATINSVLPARAVDALFGVQLRTFARYGAEPVYTAVGTPHLPPSLAGKVTGIGGLSDAANPGLHLAARSASAQPLAGLRSPSEFVLNGTTQWLVGADLTQAYGATGLFPGGSIGSAGRYPTNMAIATLLAGSYNASQGVDLPPFDPKVVDTYFNNSTNPAWPLPSVAGVPVPFNGITPPLPGSLGALNDTTGDEFENSLDLEMAGSLAPGAHVVNFYFAGSVIVGQGALTDLADAFAADLSQALNYGYGTGVRLGVVSGSFGLTDLNDSAWNSALLQAAATGVTVVIASGDQGNAPNSLSGRGDGPWPVWPASAAFNTSGALSIGGVSLTLGGRATTVWNHTSLNVTYDSNITGISGMSVWWDDLGPQGTWAGSEGGLSSVYDEPYWQFHSAAQPAVAAAAGLQGASLLGRAGPDLAFPANNTLAYVMADGSGNLYFAILEGTSIAAPVGAGLLADEESVTNSSLGYLDPELYRIASFFAQSNGSSADPFYDVTLGANYVFTAAPGWDAATGWGGFAAVPLFYALRNSTVSGYVYTGPTPGLPPSPASGGFPVAAVLIIVGLAVAAAVALVIAFGRPKHPAYALPPPWVASGGSALTPPWPSPQYPLPPPAPGAPALPPAVTMFNCPYCGSARPAEPVRCPRCGAF